MGIAIGALGNALGSMAGAALAGKQSVPGPDTSIPGISKAVIKKGGKGGKGELSMAQVNPEQALQWFRQAADQQTSYYTQGLQFYTNAMQGARDSIQTSLKEANATLKPLSYAAISAMNEQMRMVGLDPLSATQNMADRANEIGLNADLRKRIAAAENLRDPTQRANEKAAILAGIEAQRTSATDRLGQLNSTIEGISKGPRFDVLDLSNNAGSNGDFLTESQKEMMRAAGYQIESTGSPTDQAKLYAKFGNQGQQLANNRRELVDMYNAKISALNATNQKTLAESTAEKAKLESLLSSSEQFRNDYDVAYTNKYDAGYTGNEVIQKLEQTPGYQFNLDQGSKALTRQAAALGNLASGNTLTAITDYGQKLAQNTFQGYMQNLQKITELGSGATSQISSNIMQAGQGEVQLAGMLGQAGMDVFKGIGDAKAESLYQQGNLWYDAAKFNATAQNTGLENYRARQAALAQQAVSSGPGYMAQQRENNISAGYGSALQYYTGR